MLAFIFAADWTATGDFIVGVCQLAVALPALFAYKHAKAARRDARSAKEQSEGTPGVVAKDTHRH